MKKRSEDPKPIETPPGKKKIPRKEPPRIPSRKDKDSPFPKGPKIEEPPKDKKKKVG